MVGNHGLQLADAVFVAGEVGVDEHAALATLRKVELAGDLRLQGCGLLLADGVVEYRHIQFRRCCRCEDLYCDIDDDAHDGDGGRGACEQLVTEILPLAAPGQFEQCDDARFAFVFVG